MSGNTSSFLLARTHYPRSQKEDGDLGERAAPSGPARDLSVYARCHVLCFERSKIFNFWEAGAIIPYFTDEKTELYKLNSERGYLARKGTGVDLNCVTPKSGLLTSIPCCYDEERQDGVQRY